jgi:hypothetical protein
LALPPPGLTTVTDLGHPKSQFALWYRGRPTWWQRLKAEKAKRRLGKIIIENHGDRPIKCVDRCSKPDGYTLLAGT